MPNHVVCERSRSGENLCVSCIVAEQAESGLFRCMPNQICQRGAAICKSGINFRQSNGADGDEDMFLLRVSASLRSRCILNRDERLQNIHTTSLYRFALVPTHRTAFCESGTFATATRGDDGVLVCELALFCRRQRLDACFTVMQVHRQSAPPRYIEPR